METSNTERPAAVLSGMEGVSLTMAHHRIMVVDDEADVRSIICTTLRPHYEIVEAHDGLDALEKLDRTEPDFVLMDVMMPLMDGYQACEAIRKHVRYHDLPVMFLSALGTKDDIRKGYSSGANLYLTKPFEPARLLRNIEVFFETSGTPCRGKRYTIEQLHDFERSSTGFRSTIHEAETVYDHTPMPSDVAKELAPSAPSLESTPIITASRETPPPSAPFGSLPRVMAIDDDQEVINLMSMILADYFEVTFANDGLQAIERIVRHQPDLIVVDIMLPKMSGFQLCQSLRANRTYAKTPLLVCSAKCGDRDIAYARRVGANDFLPKPFKSEDLLAKLNQLTQIPGFAVQPKSFHIQTILTEISPKAPSTDAFHMDSEVRRAEAEAPAAPGTSTDATFKKFLKKEGNKDAFEKDDAEGGKKEKKKRRFLFGFGKD